MARSCSCTAGGEQGGHQARDARRAAAVTRIASHRVAACAAWPRTRRRRSPSATSPTSVWASSLTSSATLPQATTSPAERGGQLERSGCRSVCQGSGRHGQARAGARSRSATPAPAGPNAASVPAAPPSCDGLVRPGPRSRSRGLVQAGQPAGRLEPERGRRRPAGRASAPAITVSPVRAASRAAQRPRRPSRCRGIGPAPVRRTSTSAVSRMSWLVAPWCTPRPGVLRQRGRQLAGPAGTTGLPAATAAGRAPPGRTARPARVRRSPRRPSRAAMPAVRSAGERGLARRASPAALPGRSSSASTYRGPEQAAEQAVRRRRRRSHGRPAGGCRSGSRPSAAPATSVAAGASGDDLAAPGRRRSRPVSSGK